MREITYPHPVPGAKLLCYIPGVDIQTCAGILLQLRKQRVIRGAFRKSPALSTFYVSRGDPGHYKVKFRDEEFDAIMTKYEPKHAGHYGFFAPGHGYFVRGLMAPMQLRRGVPREIFC